jgi:hypothetical protein
MAAFCTASAEQILPRDSVQRNCFKLALYTTRDHDCISNRIGSGIRATFGALPTPSTIYRPIIMLNNHRFWGHASGPSSSSGKTLSSFHPLLARPCRSALPRERFRSLVLFGRQLFGERRFARERSPAVDPAANKSGAPDNFSRRQLVRLMISFMISLATPMNSSETHQVSFAFRRWVLRSLSSGRPKAGPVGSERRGAGGSRRRLLRCIAR